MTAVSAEPAEVPARKLGIVAQLTRFVLIGGFCALIDGGVYTLELHLGLDANLAKAVSFVCGTTTAYFLNRKYTFPDARTGGASRAGGFALLYGVTFCVNVGVNALVLALLPASSWEHALAWVVAQGTATLINFIMLRTVVFKAQ